MCIRDRVYTDRSLNHMSKSFQGVMKEISGILKSVYHARSTVIVPGSGTFGMEAVARQFAADKKVLIIRNGWFSFRWTQILDMGHKLGPPQPGNHLAVILVGAPSLGGKPVGKNLFYGANDPRRNTGLALGY